MTILLIGLALGLAYVFLIAKLLGRISRQEEAELYRLALQSDDPERALDAADAYLFGGDLSPEEEEILRDLARNKRRSNGRAYDLTEDE